LSELYIGLHCYHIRKETEITVAQERSPRTLYKTGDFLRRAKISRQTLYTYLTMGLIEEADRTDTGRHLFDDHALRRVEIIKGLSGSGYSLRDIKDTYFKRGR